MEPLRSTGCKGYQFLGSLLWSIGCYHTM